MSYKSKRSSVDIDRKFQLPILKWEMADKLVKFAESDVVKNIASEKFICEGVTVVVYANKWISQSDYDLVRMKKGATLGVAYETVKFEKEEPINLPSSYAHLVTACKSWTETEEPFILPFTKTSFPGLLSLFSLYPTFGPLYTSYLLQPDSNVRLVDEIAVEPAIADRKPTDADARITCHMMLLLMAKSFASAENIRGNQVRTFIANREKAMRVVLGVNVGKCLIVPDSYPQAQMVWNLLPVLKEKVFVWVYQMGEDIEFTTALLLMKNSQMLTIGCIHGFIQSELKCYAHAEPQIWEEVANFLNIIDSVRAEVGELWVYYRVLKPQDTTLANSQFPNLAKAAVIFTKTFINKSESFKNVVVPQTNTIAGIEDKAQKEDRRPIYKDGETFGSLSDKQKEGAERLGIDLNQMQPSESLRKKLEVGGDDSANLRQLLIIPIAILPNQMSKLFCTINLLTGATLNTK